MGKSSSDDAARQASAPAGGHRHWLTPERLRVYPLIFLFAFAVAGIFLIANSDNMLDESGKPLGYDFITFWAASSLSLSGEAAAAFDVERIFAAEKAAVPALELIYLWHYPPTFELMIAPLALLPYIPAYLLWTILGLAIYVVMLRRLAPSPFTAMLVVASPGVFIALLHGQSGFLAAALFGGALLLLERRPILAGILIGLLSFKPHFGVLIPLVLLLGGYWRPFLAAAATSILFAAASLLVLGVEPWVAFVNNLPLTRHVIEQGLLPWAKMPSLFVALRMLGAPVAAAYAAQIVLGLGVAAAVGYIWWRRAPLPLAGAVLVCASLLVTPYVFDYDMVLLAVPIALLAVDGHRRGWHAGEREIMVVAWLMPMLAPAIAQASQIQVGFLCLLALFAVAVRRATLAIRPATQA